MRTARRPRETKARLKENGAIPLQLLAEPLQDVRAVGSVDIVVGRQERLVQAVEAIRLAYGIRLMLNAERKRECEVGRDLPAVFAIEREGVEGDRL